MIWAVSGLRLAIERFLFESTSASRCLLVVVSTIPYMLMFLGMHAYALAQPEIRPGLNPQVVWAVQAQLTATLAGLVGLGLWLWPRRREDAPRPWAEFLLCMLVGMVYTSFALAVGLYSAGPVLVLVGIAGIGLLLFEWRVMLASILLCGGALVAYELLMMRFDAPYGPALTPAAFDAHGTKWWLTVWQSTVLALCLPVAGSMNYLLFFSRDAMYRRLRELSTVDALTGVSTRQHFMERLHAELARQKRGGRPLTLLLLDADHFADINARHGHAKGDEVLTELAQDLAAGVRAPTDVVARLGGEEFGVLLPDTALADAEIVCRRVQDAMRSRQFSSEAGSFQVTVSIGVVQSYGALAEEIMRQADVNLYRAKGAGRNRAVFSVLSAPFSVGGARA